MPKKFDRDDVPILSLIKKVEMRVNPNNYKEIFDTQIMQFVK